MHVLRNAEDGIQHPLETNLATENIVNLGEDSEETNQYQAFYVGSGRSHQNKTNLNPPVNQISPNKRRL